MIVQEAWCTKCTSALSHRSTQIATCISQAKQVNYFPDVLSFFPFPRQKGPCGMDVMRWSAKKAIYTLFVPLRSFKKANSLEADWEREREEEGSMREIWTHLAFNYTLSGSSWLSMCVNYFINVLQSLEDMHAVPNELSQEDERKREEFTILARHFSTAKQEMIMGMGGFECGHGLPKLRLVISTGGHPIPDNQVPHIDS